MHLSKSDMRRNGEEEGGREELIGEYIEIPEVKFLCFSQFGLNFHTSCLLSEVLRIPLLCFRRKYQLKLLILYTLKRLLKILQLVCAFANFRIMLAKPTLVGFCHKIVLWKDVS